MCFVNRMPRQIKRNMRIYYKNSPWFYFVKDCVEAHLQNDKEDNLHNKADVQRICWVISGDSCEHLHPTPPAHIAPARTCTDSAFCHSHVQNVTSTAVERNALTTAHFDHLERKPPDSSAQQRAAQCNTSAICWRERGKTAWLARLTRLGRDE